MERKENIFYPFILSEACMNSCNVDCSHVDRGGCYKYAFYGIESHRCMEATPSLVSGGGGEMDWAAKGCL